MSEQLPALSFDSQELINGRYRPITVLGQGGMGWVIQAEDSFLGGDQVVLKFLYPHFLRNEEALVRLKSEVLLARRLIHHNIVRTHSFCLDARLGHNIVMEYVPGRTLRDTLKDSNKEPLPFLQVLSYLIQILKGIEHAHALGVIHLDIKPENILLTENGEAKIADFGLAQSLRFGRKNVGLNGTPLYMAPEQFDDGLLDRRTDLYAIGILAFELLTGRPPFQETTLYKLAKQHSSEPLPSLLELRPELPEWMDTLLRRCTEKSISDRFPNAESMREAIVSLSPHLEGESAPQASILERPENREYSYETHPLVSFWRRRTLRVLFLAFLYLLLCYFGRRIGWFHGYMVGYTLRMERTIHHRLPLTRYLFAVKAESTDSLFDVLLEPGGVEGLLLSGKDPNEPDPKSGRIYLISIAEGAPNIKEIELLLNRGADPNLKDGQGSAALHVIRGPIAVPVAELLLAHGADVNIADRDGATPLMIAVRTQNIPLIRTLLAAKADLFIRDKNGATVFDFAGRTNNQRIQELLNFQRKDSQS